MRTPGKTVKSRQVTLEDIARELGISAMTVSRAINDRPNVDKKTKERILQVAREHGYIRNEIARSLMLKKSQTIGVVVPEITHSFFPEVIRGIEEVTYSSGYHLILAHSAENGDRERSAIRTLVAKRVDGLLISTAQAPETKSAYLQATRMGTPIVFFDRIVDNIGASCVSIDDEECTAKITQHLIDHGYKRIAHLSGPANVSIGRARMKGFKKALRRNSIEFRRHLVVESGFHEDGGYKAMKKLLQLPANQRPDAVVSVNDPAAFGAMAAINEDHLKIPDDIAIVGMSNDIRSTLVSPPLTTINQSPFMIGKIAAEILISEIEGRSMPGRAVIVQAELVIRSSCGCK